MTKIQETGDKVLANVERVIVGKHHEVRLALVALLCRGHLLIEDVPGTGKTVLAKAIARSLGCSFRRIQFTPDLLPSDVSGLSIYNQKTQEFEFRPGPDLQPGRPRRRDQPGDAEDAVRAARMHGGAPGDDRRHDLPDARSVPRHRHPEPDRVRGHVRAARGPARPVHAPPPPRLPAADRGDRDPRRAEADAPARGPRGGPDGRGAARDAGRRPRDLRRLDASSDYIVRLVNATRNHPDVYLGASPRGSIALYRAGQALAGLLGRDYVIPDDIKALAEPALAHRLIIKTSSSIHDVQAGQVVRELLETTSIDGIRPTGRRTDRAAASHVAARRRPRAPRPGSSAGRSRGARPVIRKLELLIVAAVLVVAAFSTGAAVPVLPALPRDPGHRRLVRPGPPRPDRPRGGLRGQPAPRPRRRPAAGHLHAAQRQPASPKLWLEIHNPTTLPGGLPGRAITLGGRSERSWLIRAPLSRRGHFRIEPLHIRTGDPFGFFEASATVGPGHLGRRLSAARAAPALATAGGRPSRAATRRPCGRSRRRRSRRRSGRTPRATR